MVPPFSMSLQHNIQLPKTPSILLFCRISTLTMQLGVTLIAKRKGIVQKQEWEDANANRSTMSKNVSSKRFLTLFVTELELVDGNVNCLRVTSNSPSRKGHTWGACNPLNFMDCDGVVCFLLRRDANAESMLDLPTPWDTTCCRGIMPRQRDNLLEQRTISGTGDWFFIMNQSRQLRFCHKR